MPFVMPFTAAYAAQCVHPCSPFPVRLPLHRHHFYALTVLRRNNRKRISLRTGQRRMVKIEPVFVFRVNNEKFVCRFGRNPRTVFPFRCSIFKHCSGEQTFHRWGISPHSVNGEVLCISVLTYSLKCASPTHVDTVRLPYSRLLHRTPFKTTPVFLTR